VTLLVVLGLIVKFKTSSPHPIRRGEVPEQRARINTLIADLKRESFELSVQRLINDTQQYSIPGFHTGQKMAQIDLETMLSTRRAVKVLGHLDDLPARQKKRRKELFENMLRLHSERLITPLRLRIDNPSSPGVTQSIEPTKLGLCAVMFATAQSGEIGEIRSQFLALDEFRASAEAVMEEYRRAFPESNLTGLKKFVPDNRFQLNVLRLVAARRHGDSSEILERIDQACVATEMTSQQRDIVSWNAHTTSFEQLVGSPLDKTKGVRTYTFYDWAGSTLITGEEKQRKLIAEIRRIVLE